MPHFKVVYFQIRARAELSRFLLQFAGADWSNHFIDRPAWMEMKPSTPFGQVPMLIEEDGHGKEVFRLAQSHAMERYIAKHFGLVGSNPREEAFLDSIFESYNQLTDEYRKQFIYSTPEEKEEKAFKPFFADALPQFQERHAALLQKNGNKGLYAGDKITYVELAAYLLLERLIENHHERVVLVPELQAVFDRVKNDEKIKAYIASEARCK